MMGFFNEIWLYIDNMYLMCKSTRSDRGRDKMKLNIMIGLAFVKMRYSEICL